VIYTDFHVRKNYTTKRKLKGETSNGINGNSLTEVNAQRTKLKLNFAL